VDKQIRCSRNDKKTQVVCRDKSNLSKKQQKNNYPQGSYDKQNTTKEAGSRQLRSCLMSAVIS
jgi:hypothetical protein